MSITKVSDNMRDTTTLDATKLSGNLPAISGASLTGVGKVLQVVTSADISSQASTTSTGFADTGVTASITPASTSNKVLVIATGSGSVTGTSYAANVFTRIHSTVGGEIARQMNGYDHPYGAPSTGVKTFWGISLSNLETTNTTSSVTYKIQHRLYYTNYSAQGLFPALADATNGTPLFKGCRLTLLEIAG